MSNFYLGFKGNIFSKMFMVFAVFMVMSTSLWGVAPTYTAETIDKDIDGDIDYIKITITSGNSGAYKISYVSENELKSKFEIFSPWNDDYSSKVPVPSVIGVFKDDIGTALEATNIDRASGTSIYLMLDGNHPLSTGEKPNIVYNAEGSGTTTAIYNTDSSSNIMIDNSIEASDGADPILVSVSASSKSGEDDKVTLTFSEKVKYITGLTEDVAETRLKIRDGNTDSSKIMNKLEVVTNLSSGEDTVELTIADGTLSGDYISSIKVRADLDAVTFMDLAGRNVAAINKISSDIVLETTAPTLVSTGTELNLNVNPFIKLKVSEKLKNTDDIRLYVTDGTTPVILDTKPTLDNDANTLTVSLSNPQISSLRQLLKDKVNNHTSIKVGINANSGATDALGKAINNTEVIVASYTRDATPPEIETVVYSFPNAILINFTDDIVVVNNDHLNLIVGKLTIQYNGSNKPSLVISNKEKVTDKQIKVTFNANLTALETVDVVTKNGHSGNIIRNYTELSLVAMSSAKQAVITSKPSAPVYNNFTLNMETGKIVIDFDNTGDAATSMIMGSFNPSAVSVVRNGVTAPLQLTDSSVTLSSGHTATSAMITNSAKKMTITLGTMDKERLKVFLKDEATFNNITLNIGVITTLKNNFSTFVDAKTGIAIASATNYVIDGTIPKILDWTLNLDNKEMNISFDIPIAWTGNLDKHFSITKESSGTLGLASADLFGSFNVLDIGTDSGDSSVAFSEIIGDNNKTLTVSLSDSFVNEILNDSSLATSADKAYLTIRDNTITNISKKNNSNILKTSANNLPKKLSANAFTATNGNVNILFTRDKGVMRLVDQTINSSDELKASKWFIKTIPSGVSLVQKQLLDSFDRSWTKVGNVWKNADFSLSSTKGYWLRSKNEQHRALIRATLDDTLALETVEAFKARIEALEDNVYTLVGITRDISRVMISKYPKRGSCVVYLHTYTPSESASGTGEWDKATHLKAGDALWVKQNCNSAGSVPPIAQD